MQLSKDTALEKAQTKLDYIESLLRHIVIQDTPKAPNPHTPIQIKPKTVETLKQIISSTFKVEEIQTTFMPKPSNSPTVNSTHPKPTC